MILSCLENADFWARINLWLLIVESYQNIEIDSVENIHVFR